MHPTGIDYLIYSEKNNELILSRFNDFIVSIGYIVKKDDIQNSIVNYLEFFYYKDDEMYHNHLTNGYSTNKHGEGCISLYTGKENVDEDFIIARTFKPEDDFTQTARIIIDGLFFYVLTLPEPLEVSAFSKTIYEKLLDLLKS